MRSLRLRLERASVILDGKDEGQLVAAADALITGIGEVELRRLVEAVPDPDLLTSLTVFTDLVRRGVEVGAAAGTVVDLAKAGAQEEDFVRFRRSVLADIAGGVDPVVAARSRARAYIRPRRDPATDASALKVLSGFVTASPSTQFGLGLAAASNLGTDGVANLNARGWFASPTHGAVSGRSLPSWEMTSWGSKGGVGWFGQYRHHEARAGSSVLSEAAIGGVGEMAGVRLGLVGTALWSGAKVDGVQGVAAAASLGRSLGAAELHVVMRGGGSVAVSRVGRDTVFHVGRYVFRSHRSRLVEQSSYFGDLGLLAQAKLGSATALIAAGQRLGPGTLERGRWADASLALDLGSRSSLGVRGGWTPPDPWGARAGGAWLQLGVDLYLVGRRPMEPTEDAPVRGRVVEAGVDRSEGLTCSGHGPVWRVPDHGEERVEWMGDPGNWQAETMVRTEAGWVSRGVLPEGRHRVLVRRDGSPWMPPEGLPIIEDELGAAGLLVVEECPDGR